MGFLSQVATKILIAFVRAYQVVLSPLTHGCCRFQPSCSAYMIEALQVHGPLKGLILGMWRLLRCHPFGASGFDPVPPVGAWKNKFYCSEKDKDK